MLCDWWNTLPMVGLLILHIHEKKSQKYNFFCLPFSSICRSVAFTRRVWTPWNRQWFRPGRKSPSYGGWTKKLLTAKRKQRYIKFQNILVPLRMSKFCHIQLSTFMLTYFNWFLWSRKSFISWRETCTKQNVQETPSWTKPKRKWNGGENRWGRGWKRG